MPLTGSTVFVSYLLAGLRAARPDLDIDRYLTPRGTDALARAETDCYQDMASGLGDVTIGDLVNHRMQRIEAEAAALRDYISS